MEILVNKSSSFKVQWLVSVWAGWDRIRLSARLLEWYKDALAATFLKRDRIRKKRKAEETFETL